MVGVRLGFRLDLVEGLIDGCIDVEGLEDASKLSTNGIIMPIA